MKIEQATQADAGALAYLINLAGEGMPEYVWSTMAEEGESPFDVGLRRAQRDEGGFSYTKARVVRVDHQVAGMIVDYALDDPYDIGDIEAYPEPIQPLIKLESLAPGTWYINALATNAEFRKRGIATFLLKNAEREAKKRGISTLSIIVASENLAAKKLYLNFGFQFIHALPVVAVAQLHNGGNWELLTKAL